MPYVVPTIYLYHYLMCWSCCVFILAISQAFHIPSNHAPMTYLSAVDDLVRSIYHTHTAPACSRDDGKNRLLRPEKSHCIIRIIVFNDMFL